MNTKLNGKLSVSNDYTPNLNGYLSMPKELTCVYTDAEPLELVGHLSIPKYIGETYKGSYEVIPTDGFQLLPTSDRVLTDDIIVHPIPYSEVSNEQGGLTVTIG